MAGRPVKNPDEEADNPSESAKRQKRLDFLLKQTEMFSHFLTTTGTKPKKAGEVNDNLGSPSKSAANERLVSLDFHSFNVLTFEKKTNDFINFNRFAI